MDDPALAELAALLDAARRPLPDATGLDAAAYDGDGSTKRSGTDAGAAETDVAGPGAGAAAGETADVAVHAADTAGRETADVARPAAGTAGRETTDVTEPAAGAAALAARLDELVLGAPRRYTEAEAVDRAGIDLDTAARLWRALGFAQVAPDARVFTDRDLEAVGLLRELTEAGLLDESVQLAVGRAVAQSVAGLAEWQVGMITRMIVEHPDAPGPAQALRLAAELLPKLEAVQSYVWRRHLAAAVSRRVMGGPEGADDAAHRVGTVRLAVGFADMVGFTRATRRRSTAELAEVIERFESSTSEVIADGRGRIVKTVGDEVLFVADDEATAGSLALELQARVRREPALPPLRVGVAAGDVLTRYGDVYGEPVNIAARLTAHARPGRVLVDRQVADALRDDPRFLVRSLAPLHVRGYRQLQPFLLSASAGGR